MIRTFLAGDVTIEVYRAKGGKTMLQITSGPMPYDIHPGQAALIRTDSPDVVQLMREAVDAWMLVEEEQIKLRQGSEG